MPPASFNNSQPEFSLSHIFVLLHISLFFPVNSGPFADAVKTLTLAGLCISVMVVSILYLMQRQRGDYPRLPQLILCVKAIPIIMFYTSLGTVAYASQGINGMAVLGATIIACSFICIVVYNLNVGVDNVQVAAEAQRSLGHS